ncbi:hypothetical protein, partial [Yersinia similis]
WRGRFTPLPILTVQDRVIGVCQQSETIKYCLLFLKMISENFETPGNKLYSCLKDKNTFK